MFVQSSKTILTSDSKLDINDSIRAINDQIISEAREADAFVIYDNFKGAWINGDFVNFRDASYIGKGRLRDGETGKFLLLIYYGIDPYPDDRIPPPIERLVGLYLDANEDETEGPLRMFSKTSINDSISMEENVPAISTSAVHEIIMNNVTGLTDGDVFYNFAGRSIMINAKITRLNGAIEETNTYNFTITPR